MSTSVAPMMTGRTVTVVFFVMAPSPSALLYTEMVTAAVAGMHGRPGVRHSDIPRRCSSYSELFMAEATRRAAPFGYDEININVGCPSDRGVEGHGSAPA